MLFRSASGPHQKPKKRVSGSTRKTGKKSSGSRRRGRFWHPHGVPPLPVGWFCGFGWAGICWLKTPDLRGKILPRTAPAALLVTACLAKLCYGLARHLTSPNPQWQKTWWGPWEPVICLIIVARMLGLVAERHQHDAYRGTMRCVAFNALNCQR